MFESIISLQNWIADDSLYWFCAIAGTGMFVIQFCLNLMGFSDQENIDDGGIADAGNFKWLSRQAITGFLMMFGWSTLTCQKEFNLEAPLSILIGLICGIAAIFITGFLFKMARKLHSSGLVFKIEDTIGLEAVVYQRIPCDGVGKISVCVENFVREIDAYSHGNKEVLSFARVKIISKVDDKTVSVEAV